MNTSARVQLALIPCLVLFMYWNVRHADFVFDDVKLVRDNPSMGSWAEVGAGLNIVSDRWEDAPVRINYRPVRFLSYAIDWQITRLLWPDAEALRPVVFRLHNIALHLLNAFLVYRLLRVLVPQASSVAAFLSLVWAVHPLQTESVAYISGRRDVLFATFYLAAMAVYAGGPRTWGRTAVTAALYVLGLLTKEMAVTLPAALLCLDLYLRRSWSRRAAAAHAVLWGLCLAYVAFKLGVKNPGGGAGYWGGSFAAALLTSARALIRYLWLSVMPVSLSVDWSYAAIVPSRGLLSPWTTLPCAAAAAVLIAGAGVVFLRTRVRAALGVLLFVAALAPVLQLVPHPERFAERYMYLPLLGLLVAAAPAMECLRPFKTGKALAVVVVVLCVGRGFTRVKDWRSALTLWQSAVRVNPDSARARLALGMALGDAGQRAEAEGHFDRMFEILKNAPALTALQRGQILQGHAFRAQACAHQADQLSASAGARHGGDPDREAMVARSRALYHKAASDYEAILASQDVDGTVIRDDPRHASTTSNLAAIRFRLEQYDEAEAAYRRVLALDPGGALAVHARFWIGMIRIARGRISQGRNLILEAARQTDPAEAFAFKSSLADILLKVGLWQDALAVYDELLPSAGSEARTTINYHRALVFDRLGRRADALLLLRTIRAENPGLLPVELTLVDLELKEGRWREAKEHVTQLRRTHGAVPEILAYQRQIRIQEQLAAHAPGAVPAALSSERLLALGRANLEAGDADRAAGAFQDAYLAAEAAGEEARALAALRQLARSLDAAGRHVEALQVLRMALKKAPDDERFLKDLGALLAGDPERYQEAVATYRRLESVAADGVTRIEALVALGTLYEGMHQIELAAEAYGKAAAQGTIPPAVQQRRAELLEELGEVRQAREAYRACLDMALDPQVRREIQARLARLEEEP